MTGQMTSQMTATILVSVLIPSYNNASYIEEAIASAYAQNGEALKAGEALEVIVVDDGSTDGSWDQLLWLQRERYPALKVLCHPGHANRGESLSRALALANATGTYIAVLDSDDLFLPGKLELQLRVLREHPDVVLCHTAVEVVGDISQASFYRTHFNQNPDGPYWFRRQREYLIRNRICNSSVLVRAEALRSISFATKTVLGYGDWLCWSLLAQRGSFCFLDQRLTGYRAHEKSKSSAFSRNDLRRLYALLEFKLALLARSESLPHSIRVLFSTLETLRLILVEYLWDPAGHAYGNPAIRPSPLVRALLLIGKAGRLGGACFRRNPESRR